jgi:nucleotide-binding universal stress UspA family protein
MFHRISSIAVTTDFSDLSRAAFRAAGTLAREFGARLHLVHVVPSEAIYTPWQITPATLANAEKRQGDAERRLEDLARSDPAFDGLKVDAHALLGESAEAVHRFQERQEVDLIVIASHGHAGAKDFLLGSFAGKVIQLATCPVLVFRGHGTREKKTALFRPTRILAPHDFSGPSRVALETAVEWARQFAAEARLLFVVDDKAHLQTHVLGPAESIDERLQKVRRDGEAELGRLIRDNCQGVEATAVARVGQPAAEIIKEAGAFGADLIVMASRGLSVLERLSVGSVAERTVHGAACPVLVIKRKWVVEQLPA